MLFGRKQIIALALGLLVLFAGRQVQAAEGSYTPCLVQPVFVQPVISPAIISPPDVVPPAFINNPGQVWTVQLADIDKPAFIQPVISMARYDGCENISAAYRSYIQRLNRVSPSGGNRYVSTPAAGRIFTDASLCCGGVVAGR